MAHKAPETLTGAARDWWRQVHDEYEFSPAEAPLVHMAAHALQRHEEAIALVHAEGLTEQTEYGRKQHPASAIARDALNSFRALVKQLDLDADEHAAAKRPGPNTGHIRRVK